MIDAGFPACPGEIMVRNPAWSKPLAAWCGDVRDWVLAADEQAVMNVAIFYDAAAVAGDDLAARSGQGLSVRPAAGADARSMPGSRARSTCSTRRSACSRPSSPRAGPHKDQLDLKKGGIFPLMHGVRALALERRLVETNTIQRIRRLQGLGVFDKALGQQLADAFNFLLGLRLSTRLEKMRLHQPLDNFIRPDNSRASSSATCSRTRCRSSSGSRRWCGITSAWRCSDRPMLAVACNAPGGSVGSRTRPMPSSARPYDGDELVSIDCETSGLDVKA